MTRNRNVLPLGIVDKEVRTVALDGVALHHPQQWIAATRGCPPEAPLRTPTTGGAPANHPKPTWTAAPSPVAQAYHADEDV